MSLNNRVCRPNYVYSVSNIIALEVWMLSSLFYFLSFLFFFIYLTFKSWQHHSCFVIYTGMNVFVVTYVHAMYY